MTLGPVDEDGDGEKVISNWPLPILEDRPRRHRELIAAPGAFPQLAGRERVNLEATAFGTIRFAVVIGPADRGELGMRFLIRHARDGAQTGASLRLWKGGSAVPSPYSMHYIIEYDDSQRACQRHNHQIW